MIEKILSRFKYVQELKQDKQKAQSLLGISTVKLKCAKKKIDSLQQDKELYESMVVANVQCPRLLMQSTHINYSVKELREAAGYHVKIEQLGSPDATTIQVYIEK